MGTPLIMREPYEAAMTEDWDAMIKWYEENYVHLLFPLTFGNDTAFHLAVYSGTKKPLENFLRIAEEFLTDQACSVQNAFGNTALHEAAARGNLEAVKLLVQKNKNLVTVRNERGETPLFRAAAYGRKKIVEYLASLPDQITPEKKLNDIHRQRVHASILHDAIRGEHFGTALLLLKMDESLVKFGDQSDKTALELLAIIPSAFKSGYQMNIWTTLLYFCTPVGDYDENDDNSGINDDDIEQVDSPSRWEDLESCQSKKKRKFSCNLNIYEVAETIYHLIWRAFFQEWPIIKELQKEKRKHKSAFRLAQILTKIDTSWLKSVTEDSTSFMRAMGDQNHLLYGSSLPIIREEQRERGEEAPQKKQDDHLALNVKNVEVQREDYERNPLFGATKNGVVEIVREILRVHPQAALSITPMRHNILHVSIRHRQKEIFHRVKKMRIPMTWFVQGIDKYGYTILHHAADMEGNSKRTRPGPAYQLQDELKWFRRAKKVMPSHYVRHRDIKNRTAEDLFIESHGQQLKAAQSWIKETSQSCSAVSVLVAAVVFGAVFTVPGGSDKEGHPVLLNSTLFLIFTIMDIISLWSSLTSLVTFLSILASPFELEDFSKSLPRKLTIGFTLLFLSVATTMMAFTTTIFLIIGEDRGRWFKAFSYSVAFLPISIFALMQFPLYVAFTDTLRYISKVTRKALPRYLLGCLLNKMKSKKD